jgi:chaperonin GroEL
LDEGFKMVAAGINPMQLKQGIERGLAAASQALQEIAQPVSGEEELTGLAEAVTGEYKLSLVLGEMFDVLGADAHVVVEDYMAPYVEREYFEGTRWDSRLSSRYLVTDAPAHRCVVQDPLVVLLNDEITALEDVEPLLSLMAKEEDEKNLLLVTKKLDGEALSTLVMNHQADKVHVAAVEFPQIEAPRREAMDDLAIWTGATVLGQDIGRPLRSIRWSDMGRAARAESDPEGLIVVAGLGDQAAVREHLDALRHRLAAENDLEQRKALQERIGRLAGGVAILKLGATSQFAQQELRQRAEKGIRSLTSAVRDGTVPGGGVAYLQCLPAVEALHAEGDEAIGLQVFARALEASFLRIVQNAGLHVPAVVLDDARRAGPGYGYDALAGKVVDMRKAGILDAAGVARRVLQVGTSGAMMALTTAAIVCHRKPKQSMEP